MTRLLFAVLFVSACGPASPTPSPTVPEPLPSAPGLPRSSPSALTSRSADRYDDNQSGLVTASRLKTWRAGWAAAKPQGVAGDLVVLQFSTPAAGGKYLTPTPGVRVYDGADLDMFVAARNNGLLAIGRTPADGVRVDRLLRAYGVRPNVDFLLLARGEATPEGLQALARTWLTLRYWGVDSTAMGVLQEPLSTVPASERIDTVAAHPFDGTGRVAALKVDHTLLLADLAAVRAAVGTPTLLDVRTADEFEGTALGTSPTDTTCLAGAPRCTPTFSGHIAGARNLPLERMLTADGAALRSPAELRDALAGAGVNAAAPLIVYATDDGPSAVATFALLGVLGVPARWYAPGFLEWGTLNATHPASALRVLPEASAWRTDTFPALTGGQTRWADAQTAARPLVFDPAAAAVDRLAVADVEYKLDPPALPAPGAGITDCR